jgi:hypothetical protein
MSSHLPDEMQAVMRRRDHSIRIERSYCDWVSSFSPLWRMVTCVCERSQEESRGGGNASAAGGGCPRACLPPRN